MKRRLKIDSLRRLLFLLPVVWHGTAGGQLLVQNGANYGAYNFNGTVINSSLISGPTLPQGVVLVGSNLYAVDFDAGTVGKYNLNGAVVKASLISGLSGAEGIASDGTNLYVASGSGVGKYSLNGSVVNASLVTASEANGVSVSGGSLYVSYNSGLGLGGGLIGKYKLDGTVVNASLISGLSSPGQMAISGNNLFVPNNEDSSGNPLSGSIGEYSTGGTVINKALISSLDGPNGIAISGRTLYVLNAGSGSVASYDMNGSLINASLITGLDTSAYDFGILLLPTPAITNTPGSLGIQLDGFGFHITGISNETVIIEASTNLAENIWTHIHTNILGAMPTLFTDTAWTNFPDRYYRTLAQ